MKVETSRLEIEQVKRHLLRERDAKVKRVLGIDHKAIGLQFINDLYSLPESGGSDERLLAREWLFRGANFYAMGQDFFKTMADTHLTLASFAVPTLLEIEEIAARLKAARSR